MNASSSMCIRRYIGMALLRMQPSKSLNDMKVRVRSATITYRLHFSNGDYQMKNILNDSKLIKPQHPVVTVTQFII